MLPKSPLIQYLPKLRSTLTNRLIRSFLSFHLLPKLLSSQLLQSHQCLRSLPSLQYRPKSPYRQMLQMLP
jgi:hypothetical protein